MTLHNQVFKYVLVLTYLILSLCNALMVNSDIQLTFEYYNEKDNHVYVIISAVNNDYTSPYLCATYDNNILHQVIDHDYWKEAQVLCNDKTSITCIKINRSNDQRLRTPPLKIKQIEPEIIQESLYFFTFDLDNQKKITINDVSTCDLLRDNFTQLSVIDVFSKTVTLEPVWNNKDNTDAICPNDGALQLTVKGKGKETWKKLLRDSNTQLYLSVNDFTENSCQSFIQKDAEYNYELYYKCPFNASVTDLNIKSILYYQSNEGESPIELKTTQHNCIYQSNFDVELVATGIRFVEENHSNLAKENVNKKGLQLFNLTSSIQQKYYIQKSPGVQIHVEHNQETTCTIDVIENTNDTSVSVTINNSSIPCRLFADTVAIEDGGFSDLKLSIVSDDRSTELSLKNFRKAISVDHRNINNNPPQTSYDINLMSDMNNHNLRLEFIGKQSDICEKVTFSNITSQYDKNRLMVSFINDYGYNEKNIHYKGTCERSSFLGMMGIEAYYNNSLIYRTDLSDIVGYSLTLEDPPSSIVSDYDNSKTTNITLTMKSDKFPNHVQTLLFSDTFKARGGYCRYPGAGENSTHTSKLNPIRLNTDKGNNFFTADITMQDTEIKITCVFNNNVKYTVNNDEHVVYLTPTHILKSASSNTKSKINLSDIVFAQVNLDIKPYDTVIKTVERSLYIIEWDKITTNLDITLKSIQDVLVKVARYQNETFSTKDLFLVDLKEFNNPRKSFNQPNVNYLNTAQSLKYQSVNTETYSASYSFLGNFNENDLLTAIQNEFNNNSDLQDMSTSTIMDTIFEQCLQAGYGCGELCAPCRGNDKCSHDFDCFSGVCSFGICQEYDYNNLALSYFTYLPYVTIVLVLLSCL